MRYGLVDLVFGQQLGDRRASVRFVCSLKRVSLNHDFPDVDPWGDVAADRGYSVIVVGMAARFRRRYRDKRCDVKPCRVDCPLEIARTRLYCVQLVLARIRTRLARLLFQIGDQLERGRWPN